ncbi:hypothetical protein IC235_18280 [Hymenobacter sp. BT664]|uniref:DUF4105 domain-containing protein n=1 Tax=Hymenobacter montanus TaxID=2771359 RepID=A0A927GL58_9BACT|nr:hypothetical protein [Hymenobacter montanus]MBD2769841.1 hypothetical protein [Hymenobacter montanus]
MKNFSLKSVLSLFTFIAVLSGCSKKDVAPQQPEAAVTTQDAVVTSYMVKGYLFVRLPGPFNLGHTGVGYEVREMSGTKVSRTYTYCGGVEGYASLPVIPRGVNNGGWNQFGYTNNATMLRTMRAPYGYTAYKFERAFRTVTLAQIHRAEGIINGFAARGYNVSGNNCMNASYEVLQALGAPGMAWPLTNWAPKDQYSRTVNGWSGSNSL